VERTAGWHEDARCSSTGRSVLAGTGVGAVGGVTAALARRAAPWCLRPLRGRS
jgi:hypothetical protein